MKKKKLKATHTNLKIKSKSKILGYYKQKLTCIRKIRNTPCIFKKY